MVFNRWSLNTLKIQQNGHRSGEKMLFHGNLGRKGKEGTACIFAPFSRPSTDLLRFKKGWAATVVQADNGEQRPEDGGMTRGGGGERRRPFPPIIKGDVDRTLGNIFLHSLPSSCFFFNSIFAFPFFFVPFRIKMVLFPLIFGVAFVLFGTVQSCVHNGITYKNGDEWLERSAFIMRCTINANGSWRTEVVACTIPDGRRVLVNSAIEDESDEWKCKMDASGMVTLVQGANPNARCDGRPVGSIWQEKSFELECRPGGYRGLLACITEDGHRVPVNGSRVVNGFTMVCQQFGNGTVIFHGKKSVRPADHISSRIGGAQQNYYGQNTGEMRCNDEMGLARTVGTYWTENHRFNKTCRPNGAVEVVNCVSKDGYQIPLNSQVIRAGAKYSCEMTSQGIIRFTAGPADE